MPGSDVSQAEPIGVIGLWHLGSVTAACLADAGRQAIGIDPDPAIVDGLRAGHAPVSEPGLEEMLRSNAERLAFTCDPRALAEARCAWLTFDTPVDDEDRADVEWVMERALQALAQLAAGSLVIVSSQLPVGSIAKLQERCAIRRPDGHLRFACVPENLRLGRALESFRAGDRIVAGVRTERDRDELAELLAPFGASVQWMRVESAEMTKHALNGFLATSVAFINEVAEICESVGADAEEVSRGLKSEHRIGPRAYLGPGDAFAGGTLARDIGFLSGLAKRRGLPAHVFTGVADGNAAHRNWTRRKLLDLLTEEDTLEEPDLTGKHVAIWGLTYKPGTDTLRRSIAIELCHWLIAAGATVSAHDPAVSALPRGLAGKVELCAQPLQAAVGADVLVVCTPWRDYLEVPVEDLVSILAPARVVDPAGALRVELGSHPAVRYVCVGTSSELQVRRRPGSLPFKRSEGMSIDGTRR
jgi:UDPglucose 6-dehydrogenase